jgi:hypothetical protein
MQLKNEAYETHIIKKADILALPREKGNPVFISTEGIFFEAANLTEASETKDEAGDCSEMLCSFDGNERFTPADSFNLAEKEIIELTFNSTTTGSKGLVIASRQTLLTTFLFYQGLAYMGSSLGYFLANLERNSSTKNILENPRKELGNIEVFIEDSSGNRIKAGETGETGPIATDIKIVPLNYDNNCETLKIILRLNKGLWRLDYVALADIVKKVEPLVISPSGSSPGVTKENESVIQLLTNQESALITYPGDKYFLNYQLPDDYENYELFLECRGYYLEWIRQEWLAEENPLKVYEMFFNSKKFYKDLAPQFKKIEAEMEETFWSSKYVFP